MKSASKPTGVAVGACLVWMLGAGLLGASLGQVEPPPGYYTFQPPPAGGTYVDPVFGTTIKRISDARNTPNAADGGNLHSITHEYATMSPFNRDNTRLLLEHQSYFALYDGEGNFVRNLLQVGTPSEPRWSRGDSDVLYYVYGNELRQLNVETGTIWVVRSFPEYSSISGKGESDICFDGDHFVLAGDGREIFVYEVSSGRKGPVLDAGGHAFDSLYITPNDNVSVTWIERGTDRYHGIELFDRNMNFLRQVARVGGHMDVTRDGNGDEVVVWSNAADSAPICANGVVKVRLSDGQQTCLLSLDWSLATHVSAPDNQGWVIVTTYTPGDPDPQGPHWPPYANEVLQVSLDGSQVRRLLHHRSRPFDTYNYMPRVSSARDGAKLVYSSNLGLQSAVEDPQSYSDAYLVPIQ
jgi:hypothetical protein